MNKEFPMNNQTQKADRSLVPLKKVLQRTCLSRTQLFRLKERGDFPASRKIPGGKRHFFFKDEIDRWMDGLV